MTDLPNSIFQFLACSGATTTGFQGQLRALREGVIDAITVSIGGNDVDFANTLTSCAFAPWDCSDDAAVILGTHQKFADLPGRLDTAFDAIPAGGATEVRHVFVTEYPDPTIGPFGLRCGNILAPGFQGFDGLTEQEASWASEAVVRRLNDSLAEAVTRANRPGRPIFHFVQGISSRFATHGYCAGGGGPNLLWFFWPRFVSTLLDSLTSQVDPMGAMHPNDLGHRAIADALFDDMQFLLDEQYMWVYTVPAQPEVGEEVQISVGIATRRKTRIAGGVVSIDGTTAGTTGQSGQFSTTWIFNNPGLHSISAVSSVPGRTRREIVVLPIQPLDCRPLRERLEGLLHTVKILEGQLSDTDTQHGKNPSKAETIRRIKETNASINKTRAEMKKLGCAIIPQE